MCVYIYVCMCLCVYVYMCVMPGSQCHSGHIMRWFEEAIQKQKKSVLSLGRRNIRLAIVGICRYTVVELLERISVRYESVNILSCVYVALYICGQADNRAETARD